MSTSICMWLLHVTTYVPYSQLIILYFISKAHEYALLNINDFEVLVNS